MEITNYGLMRGVWMETPLTITINNFGIIETAQGTYYQGFYGNNAAHFSFGGQDGKAKLVIQNYFMIIKETQSEFNSFQGYSDKTNNKNSHLIIIYSPHTSARNLSFKDGDSKIILDFGSGFELGKKYLLSKIITNSWGESFNEVKVDFSRLTLSDERKDIYELVNSGDSFIIRLMDKIQETPITAIYKANIRTMNNFTTMSNAMIFPRKTQNLGSSSLRASEYERGNPHYEKSLDSANHLKSYELFAYRNESVNRRIQRQNKHNYNRKSQNLTTDSANRTRELQNLAQTSHDYYFILTPFINHNLFFESGRYNLSGFDYGFLTAFSAKVAESNSLGAHFIFSYGNLGDSKDKDLSIKSLNLNVGINYKLDLIYDMYLKARGDFYYFSNALDSLTIKNIKPNNLGFGVSVIFGKDFDFGKCGVLGLEAGIDYKALKTNAVSLNSQTYKQSLLNLIYADVGVNYNKYFGGFGINLGTGFKANLAPKLAKSALLINSQTLKFTLDNDKYLGYANAGISYVLNARNFDMEFSLAYYGNYGDRVISNGGGVEWRVLF